MQPEIKLNLPEEFIPFLDYMEGDSIEEKVRIALSINLYINGSVSLAKAAELSGESLEAFIELLREQDIPWGEYTEDMKKQDDKIARKMLKEMGMTK